MCVVAITLLYMYRRIKVERILMDKEKFTLFSYFYRMVELLFIMHVVMDI